MSSKFLFLYKTAMQKAELVKCENVIKSLFRKFRKSVVFTYLQIDTSDYCIDAFTKKFSDDFLKSDACFMCYDIPEDEKKYILHNILEEYCEAHFLKGCVVCCPPCESRTEKIADNIICTHTTKSDYLQKTTQVALRLASERKRKLTVCAESDMSDHLLSTLFLSFDKALHIERKYLSFDEALLTCTNGKPQFDVVLTTERTASIMRTYIGFASGYEPSPLPSGYSVIHTKNGDVYTRQNLPYENMDNTVLFSSLLTFAAIIEKVFLMKNAADWLRRASGKAFEDYRSAEADKFITKVISEIEKPIRKHTR